MRFIQSSEEKFEKKILLNYFGLSAGSGKRSRPITASISAWIFFITSRELEIYRRAKLIELLIESVPGTQKLVSPSIRFKTVAIRNVLEETNVTPPFQLEFPLPPSSS